MLGATAVLGTWFGLPLVERGTGAGHTIRRRHVHHEHSDANAGADQHGDGDDHANRHTRGYGNANGDGDRDTDGHGNTDGNWNRNVDAHDLRHADDLRWRDAALLRNRRADSGSDGGRRYSASDPNDVLAA